MFLIRGLRARHTRGVTLIELMVTIVIFALLIALAAPSFANWMRNLTLRNTAEAIVAGIQKAREEAVRRNSVVYFSLVSLTDPNTVDSSCALSNSAGSWVISLVAPSGNCGSPSETKTNRVADPACAAGTWCPPYVIDSHPVGTGAANLSISVKAADNATDAQRILFNGLGRAWVSSGSFARSDGGADAGAQCITVAPAVADAAVRTLRVEVTDGGAARMCDTTVTDTNDSRRCRVCP